MRRGCLVITIALAIAPVTLRAGSAGCIASQRENKMLRLLIEGDPAVVGVVLDALVIAGFQDGIEIVPAAPGTAPYDARLIATSQAGTTWDNNPSIPPSVPQFPVTFGFATVVALTPDGKLLFTVTQSGATRKAATIAAAKEIAKDLSDQYTSLKELQHDPSARSNGLAKAGEAQASSPDSATLGVPVEFGVYYRGPDRWIRLSAVALDRTSAEGAAKNLLTWGISGLHLSQVYLGAQSATRISNPKPTFYLRGVDLPLKNVSVVRLEKKRDRRELRVAGTTARNARGGPAEADITGALVNRVGPGLITITTKSTLNPGEYLLRLGALESSEDSYDFGIYE